MHRQAVRKQQIDEAFGSGLRFMVGQPDAFIGFNEHILGPIGGRHHQVRADHWNIQCSGGTYRCIAEHRVQDRGDVFRAATGVQIAARRTARR